MSLRTVEMQSGEQTSPKRRRGRMEVEAVQTKTSSKDGSEHSLPPCQSPQQQPKVQQQEGECVRRTTRASNALSATDTDPLVLTVDHLHTPEEQRTAQLGRTDARRTSLKDINSPYVETRKSYRKAHRKEMRLIPFRKCYDQFEGRIVSILNKILSDRSCSKDLEALVDRMQKMTPKEILNKYIISGIKTIIRLVSDKPLFIPDIGSRLKHEFARLQHRMCEELTKDDQYSAPNHQEDTQEDAKGYRTQIIKTIYKILKKNKSALNHSKLKSESVRICEDFFRDYHANISKTVVFIRNLGYVS